jgi:hypothetical protein
MGNCGRLGTYGQYLKVNSTHLHHKRDECIRDLRLPIQDGARGVRRRFLCRTDEGSLNN